MEGQFEVNLVEDSELIIDLSATLTNTIEHGDSTSVYSPQIRLKEVALANSSTCFESVYLSYDSQFNGEMVGVYSIDVCVLKS
ncbi:hypothetical protein JCM19233_112 [Vibrio astriarenae]|nr:hypothetical protein JCM19233_112 [Vibrio sp. C7]